MTFEELLKHPEALIGYLHKENNIQIYPNYGVVVDAVVNEFQGNNILILVNNERQANELLRTLKDSLLNPEFGLYPFEIDFVDRGRIDNKMRFLRSFYENGTHIVISTLKGAFDPIIPRTTLKEIKIKTGLKYTESKLLAGLSSFGFKRTFEIRDRGEFSVQGNIVDLYAFNYDHPLRLVFGFEDIIDEIKLFNLTNYKSFGSIEQVVIFPNTYYLFDKAEIGSFENNIKEALRDVSDEYLRDSVLNDVNEIKKSGNFGTNFYFKFIASGEYFVFPTLMDKTENFVKILIEPIHFDDFLKTASEIYKNTFKTMETLPADIKAIEKAFLSFIRKGKLIKLIPLPKENAIGLPITSEPANFPLLSSSIKDYILTTLKDKGVLIATEEFERVKELLKMYDISPIEGVSKEPGLYIVKKHFDKGVETDKLVIITDREIFLQSETSKGKPKIVSSKGIESVEELIDGDLVVHRDFGIGIFRGLVKLNVDGIKEYLLVEYRNGEKLYVPLERIGFVDKYIGDKRFVPLTKLGGNDWKNSKDRAKESAKELARKLLMTQAERKIEGGSSFKPFPKEERILSLSFPYELTEDQEQALSDSLNDMESPKPMDRLICGDVGYGKTEIAIRAAFRAVLNGKQVAVLVPTTILAMQHERTFRERMRLFPIEIEALSRLTEAKKNREVIEKLSKGNIDIIIGTQRLLSKDVGFKDLSLLIIDEEQKFGVRDKEKIKALRANIKLLTLTATPIPRTLHSALLTLKSTSLIATPPSGRIPVKTFVLPFNKDILKTAITDELARSGQVFIVHNKIESIYTFAQSIKMLVPQANVAIAHGKMSSSEIENIMVSFYEGEINVLVSTTIIENGLDIPTVNTLIVDNAQNFGLSEMYQLRGRVGRSSITAFAYFFYEEHSLKSVAEERLETIREFSGEGSGIKIAMKDLEIRGAGNILGHEQHGHLVSVGYGMYLTLLEEAVRELKGEKHIEVVDVPVRLNESFYISSSYVQVNIERLNYYKRITSVKSKEEIQGIRDELIDRFGEPDIYVDNLIKVGLIMFLAKSAGVKEIFQEDKRVFLSIARNNSISIEGIQIILKENPSLRIGEDYISFEVKGSPLKETLIVLNLLNGEKDAKVDN